MCGIAGIVAFSKSGIPYLDRISNATECLHLRGPDDKGIYLSGNVALGHRRLSIIDTSHAASQPMSDESGRYHIIFNGEFFNFSIHRKKLEKEGIKFQTHSDTEVLLHLYIKEGPDCLEKVNGFFALAIYDKLNETLFIARDRMGVKPLVYYFDNDKMFFASESKSLIEMGVPKVLDVDAMHLYFQLNYLPPTVSIYKGVKKLSPGAYMLLSLKGKKVPEERTYYSIPYKSNGSLRNDDYPGACKEMRRVLDEAVQRRLISDVPLGAFLSGGLDSAVITALASEHVKGFKTFSIGFRDSPNFDETNYAELVAEKFKTDHHTFKLSTDDLFKGLFNMLDYLDEPFADSSALNVYILCREARKHITVALTGDGADELFGGYQKHRAAWIIRNDRTGTFLAKFVAPLLAGLQGSRDSRVGNKLRQLQRFSDGASMNPSDRYWQWCSIAGRKETDALILPVAGKKYEEVRNHYSVFSDEWDMNHQLKSDMQLVLAGDMLVKADLMSMANSLEVRNPFIDKEVVEFAFSLPAEYKIDSGYQKKIVRDAFRNILPPEIYERPKKGFEVPLQSWFNNELKSLITDVLLADSFIIEQNLFNLIEIRKLKSALFSSQPGDAPARVWALIVFQYWYKKYFAN